MKKLFTLIVLMACFMSAKAVEITDAFVDFSTVTELPRFGWGGSESAFARISLVDGCLHFHSDEATDPTWDCQWFPIGGVDAEVGVVYTLHYKVKGDHEENISMLGFGQTPYGQFPITTEWVEGTVDYECTSADGNMLCQAGGYVGDFDIAYLKITHEGRVEKPVEWKELLVNGDAEKSWEELGYADFSNADNENNYKVCIWAKERDNHLADDGGFATFPAHIIADPANASNHIFWVETPAATTEGDAAAWDSQIWFESPRQWKTGEQFKLSFRYKADVEVVTNTQVHHQDPGNYLYWQGIGDITFKPEWQTFEQVVTVPADANGMWSIAFNLNAKNKDPMNFYIDDLSWSQMVLDEGYFITATNTETSGVEYDFDNAAEFEEDEATGLPMATVGKAGDKDSWVNEVMISTVRGNDRQFKANTIKVKGAVYGNLSTVDQDDWQYCNTEPAASAKIKLPSEGVWNVYLLPDYDMLALVQVEGNPFAEPMEIEPNETEVIVNAVEREYTSGDNGDAPEGYEFAKDAEGNDIVGQPWDNQLCVMANRALKAGEVTVIEFDYWADMDATTNTQCGGDAPGAYVHWGAIGDVNFTTEEQHFSTTFTVPSEADGMASLTFNMAVIKDANKYHVTNFVWKLEDETETLINMEGTENFFVKEGAGTIPYEFGTPNPNDPAGISDAVVEKNFNGAIYNIAGQRVSNEYKGIVVKNGAKYLNK